MKYCYHENKACDQSEHLLDDIRRVEQCNKNNMKYLSDLLALAHLGGLCELETYIKNSMEELEKSELWMKASVSLLENEW